MSFSLIDEYIELKKEEKRIKDKLTALSEELKEAHEPGEILLGKDGYGYRVNTQTNLVYNKDAVNRIIELGLAGDFVSLTTSKLEKLCKSGKLSWAEMGEFKQQADEVVTLVLQEYVPDDAKVIA